eukprot:4037539-Pleurochrysis_carterae.AAC.1
MTRTGRKAGIRRERGRGEEGVILRGGEGGGEQRRRRGVDYARVETRAVDSGQWRQRAFVRSPRI